MQLKCVVSDVTPNDVVVSTFSCRARRCVASRVKHTQPTIIVYNVMRSAEVSRPDPIINHSVASAIA